MANAQPRQRRERGSISTDEILDGAFVVAERDGLDNLSMPELASQLQVGVTSIYWYFRSKDDLLRKMGDRATDTIQDELPRPEAWAASDWRRFLLTYFQESRRVYQGADVLTDLTLMRTSSYSIPATHRVYRGIEAIIAYLVSAGFDLDSAWRSYSVLSIFSRGFVMTERTRRLNQTPPEGELQLGLLDAETMPLIASLIAKDRVMIDMTGDDSYEYGLQLLLDQIENVHAGLPRSS
ncbi:TetR/AcrR family transcriptional regulator [Mycetocola zhadangensis]|uniref:TetR/AcrR family transcriptional regulator n=1 Tax=Mycetocola zhadangensis TaxID=1164595 RepID=UPI003A4D344E